MIQIRLDIPYGLTWRDWVDRGWSQLLTAVSSAFGLSRERERHFEGILKEYSSVISGICFSYARNAEDLKDLRQDIMINIWKGLGSFRGESNLSTWIYRVALNTCVSTVRRHSRRPASLPLDRVMEFPAEEDREVNDRIAFLHARIAELSPVDKAIITMWLDDRKYEEIAEVTGLTRNNVAVRINRIKQKLGDGLKPTSSL